MRVSDTFNKMSELPKGKGVAAILKILGRDQPNYVIGMRLVDGRWRVLSDCFLWEDSRFLGGWVIVDLNPPAAPLLSVSDQKWKLLKDANLVTTENESVLVLKLTPTAVTADSLDVEIELWRARAKLICDRHNQQLELMAHM